MTEWKKYNGSDEQIEEILDAKNGFTFRYITTTGLAQSRVYTDINEIQRFFRCDEIAEYLICNPHPLEDMICQQARTGQEVWVKDKSHKFCQSVTNTPDWNIPGAEYSFTPFEKGAEIKLKSQHLFDYDPSSINGYD